MSFEPETKTVKSVQFSILSPDEIRKRSVVEITKHDTYDKDTPIIKGLFDIRMGTTEMGKICGTCNQDNINCPGQIEFLYGSGDIGSTGTQKFIPVTGDILLFPSGLKHIAYPFHTKDVTRISMSFNVFDWSVEGKKNKG